MASGADLFTTIFLVEALNMWYAYATFAGALCGEMINCGINYRWVFHAKGEKKKRILWRYSLVWLTSIALNTAGTFFTTEATNLNYLTSKITVAMLVSVCWNYQMQRLFVFKKI